MSPGHSRWRGWTTLPCPFWLLSLSGTFVSPASPIPERLFQCKVPHDGFSAYFEFTWLQATMVSLAWTLTAHVVWISPPVATTRGSPCPQPSADAQAEPPAWEGGSVSASERSHWMAVPSSFCCCLRSTGRNGLSHSRGSRQKKMEEDQHLS